MYITSDMKRKKRYLLAVLISLPLLTAGCRSSRRERMSVVDFGVMNMRIHWEYHSIPTDTTRLPEINPIIIKPKI